MPVAPFRSFAPSRTPSMPLDPPPPYDQVANPGERSSLPVANVTNRASAQAWRPTRESGDALRPGDSRLGRFPCGVLPTKVLNDLKEALARRQRTDISLHAGREQLGAMLQETSMRQEHPSAPSLVLIGGGLHGDDAVHAPHSHRDIKRLQKHVDKLAEKKRQLAKRHQDEMKMLELKFLKLEARSRNNAPPANPPADGYLLHR